LAGKQTIGFIGIGNMGSPMAARLASAGYPVVIIDPAKDRTEAFVREHPSTTIATSLSEIGRHCDVVITMLPDSGIVEKVLFAEGSGLAASMKPNSLVLEMSSGAPTKTVELGKRLSERGIDMSDAPVSGGVARAVTGELAILVGGTDAVFGRAEPILKCMGTSIVRTGEVGTGHAAKALNNLVSAAGLLISVEALLIGKKFGLDPDNFVDVLNASSGMSNSSQKKLKQFVLSRSFASGFGLDLMVKDLTIATDVAREAKAAVPFAALCRELWSSARQLLGPGEDHTAITKFSEKFAETTLGGN
jgi:3-hydroxyisobutyrate dehydrogenase